MLDGAYELFQSIKSLEYVCYCACEVRDEALKRLLWELPEAGVTLINLDEIYGIKEVDGQSPEVCEEVSRTDRQKLSPCPERTLLLAGSAKTLTLAKDTRMATIGYGALASMDDTVLCQTDSVRESENAMMINMQHPDMIVEGFEEVDVQFLDRIMKRAQGLPWVTVLTPRCYLREITLDDLDDLYELYAQPGITDYTEPLYERAEEEQYTRDYIANMYRFYGYGMWLVCDRESGRLIGRAGFAHRDLGTEIVLEMGYVIGVPYQRQGYAYEVCEQLIQFAKKNLSEFGALNCFVEPGNAASHGLLRKLEFSKGGHIVIEKKQMVRYFIKLQ